MPVVTFMKSSEDTLVGWLQESILPGQLCPGARAAVFELREDFQVAMSNCLSHMVEFWHGSPFKQWQRLYFAGVIV